MKAVVFCLGCWITYNNNKYECLMTINRLCGLGSIVKSLWHIYCAIFAFRIWTTNEVNIAEDICICDFHNKKTCYYFYFHCLSSILMFFYYLASQQNDFILTSQWMQFTLGDKGEFILGSMQVFPSHLFSFSVTGHSHPTGKPLPCPQKWTALVKKKGLFKHKYLFVLSWFLAD